MGEMNAEREAWLESYRAIVADFQRRQRAYLAVRIPDLIAEISDSVRTATIPKRQEEG